MTTLRLLAPAKLNLVLKVIGRRADGYHLLDTLFHAIDLGDELTAQRREGADAPHAPGAARHELAIAHTGERTALPVADDNLVLRAARAFAAATGRGVTFRFFLHKRIPHGGGLGGGSSDAAAALRLCNELCGRPLDGAALHAIARGLGADVPFFLALGSQRGRGIGDELTPVEVPPRHFVLVVPPFDCPTAAVYKNLSVHWNASFDAASIRAPEGTHHKDQALSARYENDLEDAATAVRPQLATLRARARELGAPSLHLTGSGSTCFVPADSAAHAEQIEHRLRPLRADGTALLRTRSLAGVPAPVAVAADDPWWGLEEVRSWAR